LHSNCPGIESLSTKQRVFGTDPLQNRSRTTSELLASAEQDCTRRLYTRQEVSFYTHCTTVLTLCSQIAATARRCASESGEHGAESLEELEVPREQEPGVRTDPGQVERAVEGHRRHTRALSSESQADARRTRADQARNCAQAESAQGLSPTTPRTYISPLLLSVCGC
jgi:hypothetical protein